MGTYAEVELKVTVRLSQPWSDSETADVVRNRAKIQAEEILTRILQKGGNPLTIGREKMVMIYSKTDEE